MHSSQEESRSISENVTWGRRREFEAGKVSLPYAQFLGYEKGEDGRPKVVESEAKIVRQIFTMFLEGITVSSICRRLTEDGIPTPSGKRKWANSTVKSILQNEKYKGEALLQKSFTLDYLEKIRKKNNGEVPQYYVENSHPAIVRPEVFDLAQEEMRKYQASGGLRRSDHYLSSRVFCGECGGVYGSKVWNSSNKYRRVIWQCNNRYKSKGKPNCKTPFMKEETLQWVFVEAFNQMIADKDRYIAEYEPIIAMLTDTSDLETEGSAAAEACEEIYILMKAVIDENARQSRNSDDCKKRYQSLADRYETAKQRLADIQAEIQSKAARRTKILNFLDEIRKQDALLTEFNEPLWRRTVERVTVQSEREVVLEFKDGRQISIDTRGR